MKYLKIIFPFLIILIAISCTKKSNEYNISFQEQSFANDVLATVSMLNDSVYVVGGENGEIYLLNSSNDSVVGNDKPDLARIYCLYADGDTFYAGVRNSGIVKLVRENKKLKIVKQQYKIPQKGTNYSPYNIIPYHGNTLIAMTSNGLYYLSNDTSDVLHPIPYGPDSGTPFSYCSPISIGDDIYVGTTKGIVKINSKHGKPVVVDSNLVNKAISKVVKGNDNTIYALSECHGNDTLYTINIKGDSISIDSCGLDFSALSFVKAEDKFYFVNEHNLYVISSLDNMNHPQKEGNSVVIKLPHAPLSDAKNLIAYDKHAKKIRIITQKALLSLSSVNSIGQSKGQICGICYDEKNNKVYFQNTKNEIFEYENGQASKSKFVKFDPAEEISSLSAFDNTLFYIANHEQVKSRKTSLLHFLSNQSFNLPKKSTAMLVDDSVVYVGVRDSLLRINLRGNRIESLIKDLEPYVTKIKKHGDDIVISSLNDGLLFLHNDTCRKTMYEDVHFQNDFAFTSTTKDSILLLNNHYLRFYSDTILQDSVALRGYERLLFSPRKQVGVAIKRSGVQYFKLEDVENRKEIQMLCNESRPISPDGCMIINDTLFLAADEGMLKTPLVQHKLPNYSPVNFAPSDSDETKTALCIAIIIVLLLLIYIVRVRIISKRKRRKNIQNKAKQFMSWLEVIDDENLKRRINVFVEKSSKKYTTKNMDDLENESEDIQDAIDKMLKKINDQFVVLSNLKEFHQESLNGIIQQFMKDEVFNLLDGSLQSEIKELKDKIGKLHDFGKEGKKTINSNIGNRLDTITIKVIKTLQKRTEELKNDYLNLVKYNGSKMEEPNEDNSPNLSSEITFYEKRIKVEREIKRYKFLFERKKVLTKEEEHFPVKCRPITNELHQTEILRKVLDNGKYNSQQKLDELNRQLLENQEKMQRKIVEHIDLRLETLNDISKEEQDNGIALRLKREFEKLKIEAQSFSVVDIKYAFELINKVTLNDGRLLMFNQIMAIREIAKRKNLADTKKIELKYAIDWFYYPVFAYHLDLVIYNQLLECSKDENGKYSPKGNERGSYHVQQPFYILAIAMAKSDNHKRNGENYAYFFPKTPDSSSISRAKGFTEKWVESTFVKGLNEQMDKKDSPLYTSVLAYYLSRLASAKE